MTRRRLHELSQAGLEAKLRKLRSQRGKLANDAKAARRVLRRAEDRVLREIQKRNGQ